ncbi:MAG: hypothetical protein US95_C0055G0007, partial [Candidatus Woesebacteria bacterium GW2011_GWB1_38_5]
EEDLIPDEESVLVLTKGGYLKRKRLIITRFVLAPGFEPGTSRM